MRDERTRECLSDQALPDFTSGRRVSRALLSQGSALSRGEKSSPSCIRLEFMSRRPAFDPFMVEGDGKNAFWMKIGAAWPHDDGKGFNLQLSAMQISGRI